MQTVIETASFLAHAKDAGISDQERQGIIDMLANNPFSDEIIKRTGGARKARYAKEGRGKSAGYRVITYYVADDVPVFLLDVYGKGQKVNLIGREKQDLARVLEQIAPAYRASAKAAAAATETIRKKEKRT